MKVSRRGMLVAGLGAGAAFGLSKTAEAWTPGVQYGVAKSDIKSTNTDWLSTGLAFHVNGPMHFRYHLFAPINHNSVGMKFKFEGPAATTFRVSCDNLDDTMFHRDGVILNSLADVFHIPAGTAPNQAIAILEGTIIPAGRGGTVALLFAQDAPGGGQGCVIQAGSTMVAEAL